MFVIIGTKSTEAKGLSSDVSWHPSSASTHSDCASISYAPCVISKYSLKFSFDAFNVALGPLHLMFLFKLSNPGTLPVLSKK